MANLSGEWLKAANDDLLLIDKIQKEMALTHLIAFHSQQAVEKSLKAFLEHNNIDIPKTHSLNKLFTLCAEITIYDEDVVTTLDSLYIESRYPGDLGLLPYGKPTLSDAEIFYTFAKEIFLRVSEQIA